MLAYDGVGVDQLVGSGIAGQGEVSQLRRQGYSDEVIHRAISVRSEFEGKFETSNEISLVEYHMFTDLFLASDPNPGAPGYEEKVADKASEIFDAYRDACSVRELDEPDLTKTVHMAIKAVATGGQTPEGLISSIQSGRYLVWPNEVSRPGVSLPAEPVAVETDTTGAPSLEGETISAPVAAVSVEEATPVAVTSTGTSNSTSVNLDNDDERSSRALSTSLADVESITAGQLARIGFSGHKAQLSRVVKDLRLTEDDIANMEDLATGDRGSSPEASITISGTSLIRSISETDNSSGIVRYVPRPGLTVERAGDIVTTVGELRDYYRSVGQSVLEISPEVLSRTLGDSIAENMAGIMLVEEFNLGSLTPGQKELLEEHGKNILSIPQLHEFMDQFGLTEVPETADALLLVREKLAGQYEGVVERVNVTAPTPVQLTGEEKEHFGDGDPEDEMDGSESFDPHLEEITEMPTGKTHETLGLGGAVELAVKMSLETGVRDLDQLLGMTEELFTADSFLDN